MNNIYKALSIAGIDPTGGAGIHDEFENFSRAKSLWNGGYYFSGCSKAH